MSLSQALSTSVAGLRTTQASLALVASNVANAETPGYVRKSLVQTTTAAGGSAISVRAAAVNRELDVFLQRQLRVELSGAGYADLRALFYSRLQGVYGEPGSESALETVYNEFTKALQILSTSAESSSARSTVLTTAQVLAQTLNSTSNDIQQLRSDAELGLSQSVQAANNALSKIADINQILAASQGADATTAALLDQRDAYVDQLATLMDIRVVQGDRNRIDLFTNSGLQLVGAEAAQLAFDAQGTMTASAQWSSESSQRTVGTLQLVSPGGTPYDLFASNSIRSGQIAAYVEMRDKILTEAQSQMDSIAAGLASALSDRTVAGSAMTSGGADGFDLDLGSLLVGNTIHLTYTDNGQQHRVSVIRVDDPSVLPLQDTATPDANDHVIGVDFSGGVAGVVNFLNARFNGKLQFSNPAGMTLRVLDDGIANNTNVGGFSATVTTSALTGNLELPMFTDAASLYTGAITKSGGQMVGLAGRLVVNQALMNDPSKLVLYQPGILPGDEARPNFILDRITNGPVTFSPESGIGTAAAPFIGPLSGFMRQVVSYQGESASNAEMLARGQDVVLKSLQQRIDEHAGVDIDREMANLVGLQNAYAANARIMTAIKEMLDTLMRM